MFVVYEADRPGADSTVHDLENMLAFGAISSQALADSGVHAHRSVRPDGTVELRGSLHERLIAESAEIARAAAEVVRGALTLDEAVERLAESLVRRTDP